MDFPLPATLEVRGVYVQPIPGGMMLGADNVTFEAGAWAACVVCAPVVARRDPVVLATHVLAEWVAAGHLVTPADLVRLQSLYRVLLPALGPPHPSE